MRRSPLRFLLLSSLLAACGNNPKVVDTSGFDIALPHPDFGRPPPDMVGPCGECSGATPVCDVGARKCVACLADDDCPGLTICRAKQCVPGCSKSKSECGDAGSCDLDAGVCHGCLSNRDCPDPKASVCDVVSGRCVACLPQSDTCPDGSWCAPSGNAFACTPGCKTDVDCQQRIGANGLCCAHQCVDVSTSNANCGACGTACGNGVCCNKKCQDTQNDVANCGACGKVCPAMNNQPLCKAGVCSSGSCNNGFADCDGQPGNGCEVSVQSDQKNCGSCGKACMAAHADTLCLAGSCTIGLCNAGYRDCNLNYGDGCEINVAVDPLNCGTCGASCAALQHAKASCGMGMCTVGQCDAGWGNCNAKDADGCETDITTDQKNCGGCGKACPGPANTVISCVAGVCGAPGVCLPGFFDCNNNMADGCEINIDSDVKNCGACGNSCGAAVNAAASCTKGVCSFTCNKGYADCDGNKGNGCEALLDSDKNNCGACGNVCPQNAPLCALGKCSGVVKSCKEILDGGLSVGDGVYSIDPDGNGPNPAFKVYCEMTTDGGGWEVQAYIRASKQWDWAFYTDNGVVGDTAGGFSSSATLKSANDSFNEKIVIYLNLIENGASLGKQFQVVRRADAKAIAYSTLDTTDSGWSFRDSYGKTDADAGKVCTHGCGSFRTHGMFHDNSGINWHGTQGGDYGCRDGNNICWMSRGLGCNVGNARCANITGQGEGVIYAVRYKP